MTDRAEKGTATLRAARAYRRAGYSLLPVVPDGTKRPWGEMLPLVFDGQTGKSRHSWDPFKERCPTEDEIARWFGGPAPAGIGIVGGRVSGNLERLDFDRDAESVFGAWRALAEEEAPGLVARLPVVRTPRDPEGYHVYYRCEEEVPGNHVLARDRDGKAVLVETRGEGGYTIAPGSPPACHPSGRPYRHHSGPPVSRAPVLSAAEREVLVRLARSFDRHVREEDSTTRRDGPAPGAGLSPGDDFNARGPAFEDLLRPHGWTRCRGDGAVCYLTRPGKDRGVSASAGYCTGKAGHPLLKVFTSSATPFEAGGSYSRFRVYALLEHQGDFAAAAAELARRGYGASGAGAETKAATPPPDPPWPKPLAAEAFHGLAGEFVRLVGPHSEADPAALLFQLLVAFGNVVGRGVSFRVEGDVHHCNESLAVVGKTSKARKGTSWGQVRRAVEAADMDWARDRVCTGLASGEGVKWHVRDPIYRRQKDDDGEYEEVEVDPGVDDKRLLVVEPELAGVLKAIERQGNTLSAVLRVAWDGHTLCNLTKNDPITATDPHVSVVGHITVEELRRCLSATEAANGFANRFLFVCARRSKLLPDGGAVPWPELQRVQAALGRAAEGAAGLGELRRDDPARQRWHHVYGELAADQAGLAGALLARSEAHVLRLSLVYAALDVSEVIRDEHLLAALACWDYVEASVRHVFGDSLGDAVADDILRLLRAAPAGLTRTEITNHFGRNQPSARIGAALDLLQKAGLAACVSEGQTGGRPAERWTAVGRGA